MSEIIDVLRFYKIIGNNAIKSKMSINCFVHRDSNPSMTIRADNNSFYCFACGAYGDYLDAICEIEKVNKLQAVKIFNDIQNDEHFATYKAQHKIIMKKEYKFREAIEKAELYFSKTKEINWNNTDIDYMFKRGFNKEILEEVGIKRTFNSKYKIVAPIMENGHFRGYVKRRTDGEDTIRKYLFNDGFKGEKIVHGDYYKDWVIITEGYMDWLKFRQAGFKNVVAILKWRIGKYQLKKIMRKCDNAISALDNSDTGDEGTEILKESFKNVIRFPIPDHRKDVGEMTDYEIAMARIEIIKQIKERKMCNG